MNDVSAIEAIDRLKSLPVSTGIVFSCDNFANLEKP